MHFSSSLAPLLLLVGQITIISAAMTPEEILIRFRNDVEDVNSAESYVANTTAVNAVTQYSKRSCILSVALLLSINDIVVQEIVQLAVELGNGFLFDDNSNLRTQNLNKTAEKEISVVAVGQVGSKPLLSHT